MKIINKIITSSMLIALFYTNAAQINIAPVAVVAAVAPAVGIPNQPAIQAIIGGIYTFNQNHLEHH
jgi:hypothetical protein